MDANRTLSAKEIAARHGVSAKTVRKLAAEGQIPADRIGKVFRFNPAEVESAVQLSRSSSGNGHSG